MNESTKRIRLAISFSGKRGDLLAGWLFRWITILIPTIYPYYSSKFQHGTDWFKHIQENFAKADAVIFCVTPENIVSEWQNFELGLYLGNQKKEDFEGGFAAAVRLDHAYGDMSGPFQRIQSVDFSVKEMWSLFEYFAYQSGSDMAQVEQAFISHLPEMEIEAKVFLEHAGKKS